MLHANEAKLEDLKLVHSEAYIESVKRKELHRKATGINEQLFRAARLAAGGTIQAVQVVCDQKNTNNVASAFAIVRPPGHHAFCQHDNDGFCFFNNIAVAALVAQRDLNMKKIVIFDWDLHFGDGTS